MLLFQIINLIKDVFENNDDEEEDFSTSLKNASKKLEYGSFKFKPIVKPGSSGASVGNWKGVWLNKNRNGASNGTSIAPPRNDIYLVLFFKK